MEWTRRPGSDPADPHGVADLLARACGAVATNAVEGTRFVFSTKEMLRVSREIEQSALMAPEDPLYVGVQHGYRLNLQDDVYSNLVERGVEVIAFGMDAGTRVEGVRWVRVDGNPRQLAASWFLVRQGADPHALVGFEIAEPVAGIRQWEGFESRDSRLIDGMISYLDSHVLQSAATLGTA